MVTRKLPTSMVVKKRVFDLLFAILGLLLFGWVIVLAAFLAWLDTGENGFFTQHRVGRHGKLFKIIKIRTMRSGSAVETSVTTSRDPRITKLGRVLRKTKIDELPQLINVLLGQMSFVGPRPDVPGFADQLTGDDRVIVSLRPGITGPATIYYQNEEELLAQQSDPERYNRDVIYPHKVKMTKQYIKEYSFGKDVYYILKTLGI